MKNFNIGYFLVTGFFLFFPPGLALAGNVQMSTYYPAPNGQYATLAVSGNATVGGTQTVTGAATFNGGATIATGLTVSNGNAVVNGGSIAANSANNGYVTLDPSAGSLEIGAGLIGGVTAVPSLDFKGNSHLANDFQGRVQYVDDGTGNAGFRLITAAGTNEMDINETGKVTIHTNFTSTATSPAFEVSETVGGVSTPGVIKVRDVYFCN